MSEDVLSGLCIGRAFRHKMTIYDRIRTYYQKFLVPHRFYTTDERIEIMHEILEEVDLDETYTMGELAAAFDKELHYRSNSPLPAIYKSGPTPKDLGSFIVTDEVDSPLCGNLTGEHLLRFLDVFVTPSILDQLKKKKILVPKKVYDAQIFHRIAVFLKPGMTSDTLSVSFDRFLLVPDINAYLGHDAPVAKSNISTIHRWVHSTKLGRIRDEVVVAKQKSVPFVGKFFDVVLERVTEDHYELETAHFGSRQALVDRLQQLPSFGMKRANRGQVKYEFIEFDDEKKIVFKFDVIRRKYPFLGERLETETGNIFLESFLEYLRTTYPQINNPKPVKAALLFTEKLFSWAATTLEFEKELVDPIKSNYTFFSIPHEKLIPLRVMHLPAPTKDPTPFGFCFLDEVLHALRIYQKTFGDLPIEIPAPNHPGPVKMFLEFSRAHMFEDHLREMTKNRIVYDLVVMPHVPFDGATWFPLPGPYNRHLINANLIINDVIDILVTELKLGFQLDPKHPEVAAYGEKLVNFFPGTVHGWLIDLQGAIELKHQAHALRKYQVEKSDSSEAFRDVQCSLVLLSLSDDNMEEAQKFLRRCIMVQAFPRFGRALHLKECNGDICCLSVLPGFRPFFGPVTEEMSLRKNVQPSRMCNGPGDRNMPIETFEEIFKVYI